MDKLAFYRQTLKNTIQAQADLMNSQPVSGEEVDCVFDEQRDHYLLLKYGWPRGKHIHYTKLHARIHEGKIWIEEDATEEGLANELVAAGIPKDDIVLGFNPPLMRQHTDFAIV
ncbi:MAG: XisI protein [Capsulimonadales bacterium]|nr:XisI protein [Capsulimonadales bacterium]